MPRGELMAATIAVEWGLIPMTYVGDCRFVIDGGAQGVPPSLMASQSKNADLWARLAAALDDHWARGSC